MKELAALRKPAPATGANQETAFFSRPTRPFAAVTLSPTGDTLDLETWRRNAERFGHRLEAGPEPLPSAMPPLQRMLKVDEAEPAKELSGEEREVVRFLQDQEETFHFTTWAEAVEAGRPMWAARKDLTAFAPPDKEKAQSPTASWQRYMAALLADLGDPASSGGKDTDLRDRVVSSVLLHRAHAASFLSLDPPVPKGEPQRQESPLDRADPMVYYRSQDKGHPLISLYKDWMEELGHAKGLLVAPHNPDVRDLLTAATGTKTPAANKLQVEQTGNVTLRESGHSEVFAAHVGLRQSNPSMLAYMTQAAVEKGKLDTLVRKTFTDQTGNDPPTVGKAPAVTEEHLLAVLDELTRMNSRLGVLSQSPEPVAMDEEDEKGKEEAATSGGIVDRDRDPILSSSHVTRKLGQTAERADRMIEGLPDFNHLKVARQEGNPLITVEIPKVHEDIGSEDHAVFTDALRVYFGAKVAHVAAENGMSLTVSQRQSFGFLDTSVTDTAESFRLSWGTEPPEFRQVIGLALEGLDDEIGKLLKGADTPKSRLALAGVTLRGNKKPLRTLSKSPDARHIAYYKSLHAMTTEKGYDLGNFLAYARSDPSSGPKIAGMHGLQADMESGKNAESKVVDRLDYIQKLATEASTALAKVPRAKGNVAVSSAHPRDYELPIVEPLLNTTVLAADVISKALDQEAFSPTAWSTVRLTALGDMLTSTQRISQALDELESLAGLAAKHAVTEGSEPPDLVGVRSRLHITLRNGLEDLTEAMLALLATTGIHTGTRAEDRAVQSLQKSLEMDDGQVSVFRTDSGQQAGSMSLTALKKESDADFVLDADHHPYFELPSFLKENKLLPDKVSKGAEPRPTTATLVDPRPYLTTVGGKASEPQKLDWSKLAPKQAKGTHTFVIDTTNIDAMHPDILDPIRAERENVKNGRYRFVLFHSGVKHEQFGMDKFQYGRISIIGKPLTDLKDFNRNPLLNQYLNVQQDLRDQDARSERELLGSDGELSEEDEKPTTKEIPGEDRESGGEELSSMELGGLEEEEPFGDEPEEEPGITNVGNSCYLSAVLNLLAAVGPYQEVFEPREGPDDKADLRGEIHDILTAVRAGHQVPAGIIVALRENLYQLGFLTHGKTAQQDASEILSRLLDLFRNDLHGLKLPTATVTDFTNTQIDLKALGEKPEDYRNLDDEGLSSTRAEPTPILQLPIAGHTHLADALKAYFGTTELVGPLTVKQGEDWKSGLAEQQQILEGDPPRVITIALKRFLDTGEKLTHEVKVPQEIQVLDADYRLKTVVHHLGDTPGGGHYVTTTRDDAGSWTLRNDERVQSNPDSRVQQGSGYLYTFERVDEASEVLADETSEAMQEEVPEVLTDETSEVTDETSEVMEEGFSGTNLRNPKTKRPDRKDYQDKDELERTKKKRFLGGGQSSDVPKKKQGQAPSSKSQRKAKRKLKGRRKAAHDLLESSETAGEEIEEEENQDMNEG